MTHLDVYAKAMAISADMPEAEARSMIAASIENFMPAMHLFDECENGEAVIELLVAVHGEEMKAWLTPRRSSTI